MTNSRTTPLSPLLVLTLPKFLLTNPWVLQHRNVPPRIWKPVLQPNTGCSSRESHLHLLHLSVEKHRSLISPLLVRRLSLATPRINYQRPSPKASKTRQKEITTLRRSRASNSDTFVKKTRKQKKRHALEKVGWNVCMGVRQPSSLASISGVMHVAQKVLVVIIRLFNSPTLRRSRRRKGLKLTTTPTYRSRAGRSLCADADTRLRPLRYCHRLVAP